MLCESAWHMVRAKCTDCGAAADLDYLSFDTTEATVRAESCGVCHGYLKIISLERDRQAEAVADDLATLPLDHAVAAEVLSTHRVQSLRTASMRRWPGSPCRVGRMNLHSRLRGLNYFGGQRNGSRATRMIQGVLR